MSCLKLGLYKEALKTITDLQDLFSDKEWTSTQYTRQQMVLLNSVCLKLLEKWDEAFALYASLRGDIKTAEKHKVKDLVVSVLLLPLEKSKIRLEDSVKQLRNVIDAFNTSLFVDSSIAEDLKRIKL